MSRATWQKLQLNPDKRIKLINPPDDYWRLVEWSLDEYPEMHETDLDFIHIFCNDFKTFSAELVLARELIKPNGGIWVSWYKKSSGRDSEITGEIVRNFSASIDLVDNKICSIDEDWTACRVVIPLTSR